MNQVAAILNSLVIYRYSLILALAGAAGVCIFMACCSHARLPGSQAAACAVTAVILSLPLARLLYWYGRPDSFASFSQAMSTRTTESFALAGAFGGCFLSAMITGARGKRKIILDCMSVAGCVSIALGRLGSFFTETDRGQVMTQLTGLPWAYPVMNTAGQMEYRFATFLFQAAVAAMLAVFLGVVFFHKHRSGEITVLFLLVYSASQVILDSTRYDSLYLRSNGFVSMVQIFAAVTLAFTLVILSIQSVKILGRKKWMIPLWFSLSVLFAGAGYMEYYVQRHGRQAAFAYSVMGGCLICIVGLGLLLWKLSRSSADQ